MDKPILAEEYDIWIEEKLRGNFNINDILLSCTISKVSDFRAHPQEVLEIINQTNAQIQAAWRKANKLLG